VFFDGDGERLRTDRTCVSRAEEGGGYDGDAVWSAVSVLAGGDDGSVEEFGAEPGS